MWSSWLCGSGPTKPGSSSNSIRAISSRPTLMVAIRVSPSSRSPSPARGRRRRFPGGRFRHGVDAVEASRLSAISCLEISANPPSGVWKLRKRAGDVVLKPCTTSGGAEAKAFGREQLFLVHDQNCEPALEDVERIRVLPVEVRARSVSRGIEMRFGDAELLEVGLDHDPAVEQRLALARPEHDCVHHGRV